MLLILLVRIGSVETLIHYHTAIFVFTTCVEMLLLLVVVSVLQSVLSVVVIYTDIDAVAFISGCGCGGGSDGGGIEIYY